MSTITKKDPRLEELFQVENEVHVWGITLIEDPYPSWKKMLARAAVMKGTLSECMGLPPQQSGQFYSPGLEYYTALSFNAVNEVFMDPETFSSDFYNRYAREQIGDTILSMGGERHRRYRDLVQAYFQPGAASSWWQEKFIKGAVDELISAFEKEGRADLNSQFFARLPMSVITAAFGLSAEQGLEFRYNMHRAMMPRTPAEEKGQAMKKVLGILGEVIAARQKEPQDDIISKMTQAKLKQPDGSTRPLNFQETLDFCRVIMFAGGGTTWRQLGITTLALLNNPDQLEAVKKDRSLMPAAVLESARWHPTDPFFPRITTKDTKIQGVDVPKGCGIHLCMGSANRDPSRWDNPDRYDISRPMQRGMAFGTGVHSCLGQHVARQEISAALNAILDRLPNVRWDPDKPEAKIMGGLIGRGPGPLHVVFG